MKRALVILFLLCASAASAADFILVVPVEVANMPPVVKSGRLNCRVLSASGRDMGSAYTDFALTGGAYSGQVRVRILPGGYPTGTDPIPDGRSFACHIQFAYTCSSATGGTGSCITGANAYVPPDSPAASLFRTPAGVTNVPRVEGTFLSTEARALPRRFE